ncbi:hypothetical protein D9758_006693 [Tetrapyrgos nigripes]|uniref:Aminoglycoside phosphotransferase domain-containing protein n=1 Tax=Tetrapyrgos nigripes TaxID=182062 RepID=A0A8H5GJ24_9AGAR|nr:hypothetical protein D9758_006693 [Tetrapyrgos nigripes]
MSKLPGRQLEELPELSPGEMKEVADDIISIVNDLWSIQQPSSIQGQVMVSASGHGLPHPGLFLERLGEPQGSISQCYKQVSLYWDSHPDVLKKPVLKDSVVWTHTDLAMRNVMVQNGRVTGIVDWEDAGWYPRHWLLHGLRTPRMSCMGIWVRYWINEYRFDDPVEEAYKASLSLLTCRLAY